MTNEACMKYSIILYLTLLIHTPLFSNALNEEVVMQCIICFDDNPQSSMVKLPCDHYFDAACIYTWFLESNTCPLCKADPDELQKKNNDLLWHAEKGHTKQVKKLLTEGAKLETTNGTGWTPLILAAHFGRLAVVQALLAAGANIHAKTKDGCTPLMQAMERHHPRVVRALLAAGAN